MDKWENDNCTGCDRTSTGHIMWYDSGCEVHGHCSLWKNLEMASAEECNGVCVINPNDIVWFDIDCPVHCSLSNGKSITKTFHHPIRSDLSGTPTPKEQKWLDMIDVENRKVGARRLADRIAWLRKMVKIEDEAGCISVGGLAVDLGLYVGDKENE